MTMSYVLCDHSGRMYDWRSFPNFFLLRYISLSAVALCKDTSVQITCIVLPDGTDEKGCRGHTCCKVHARSFCLLSFCSLLARSSWSFSHPLSASKSSLALTDLPDSFRFSILVFQLKNSAKACEKATAHSSLELPQIPVLISHSTQESDECKPKSEGLLFLKVEQLTAIWPSGLDHEVLMASFRAGDGDLWIDKLYVGLQQVNILLRNMQCNCYRNLQWIWNTALVTGQKGKKESRSFKGAQVM